MLVKAAFFHEGGFFYMSEESYEGGDNVRTEIPTAE